VRVLEGIEQRGRDLFRAACERDLEGIVGKWRFGSYNTDGRSASWMKIKNPAYSEMKGRHELFAPARGRRAAVPVLELG
jgi:ATP-dependent DNA ligase